MQVRLENRAFKSIIGLWLLLILLGASAQAADSVKTKVHNVTKLAEGVYAIRHPDSPDAFPQGNTTIIKDSLDAGKNADGRPLTELQRAAYREVWGH